MLLHCFGGLFVISTDISETTLNEMTEMYQHYPILFVSNERVIDSQIKRSD